MPKIDPAPSGFKQIPRRPRSQTRISVVGTIGSGKSTFARKASKILNAPYFELDALHWEHDWVEASNEVFRERVKNSIIGDAWVIDGNYHQVRDMVWSRANMVVWLDYPFTTIIGRLASRTLRRIVYHEELWNGNREHMRGLFTRDSVFLWAVRTYRRRKMQYPVLLGRPENSHLRVVRLHSPREAEQFLLHLHSEVNPNKLSQAQPSYSETLRATLVSKGIWHRFIEFDYPVRTVDEASRAVPADKIIKSIVLIGSDKKPILAILPANNRISYKKIKALLKIKDVRLALIDEVLEHSGYPVGGVPPFNKISRVLLDPAVQRNDRSIAGGGDPDKLVELETQDLLEFLDPFIADLSV